MFKIIIRQVECPEGDRLLGVEQHVLRFILADEILYFGIVINEKILYGMAYYKAVVIYYNREHHFRVFSYPYRLKQIVIDFLRVLRP